MRARYDGVFAIGRASSGVRGVAPPPGDYGIGSGMGAQVALTWPGCSGTAPVTR
jgi:hypothetical protein